MTTTKADNRFNDLIANLIEFDEKMDKLRRVRNWLTKQVDEACLVVDQSRDLDLNLRLPIGLPGSGLEVGLRFGQVRAEPRVVFYLWQHGNVLSEGDITLEGLRQIFVNPNPALDVAAQFCDKLGCYEAFTAKTARFSVTRFNL